MLRFKFTFEFVVVDSGHD